MVSLRRPSAAIIREFLAAQSKLGFTYAATGATGHQPPAGYDVDHTRIKLGEGEEVFNRATGALRRWEHFRLEWVEALPVETPIRTGEAVAILARNGGVWWLNACRIVYVIDEDGPTTRFGFAYGTLPGHAESGEERFLVEWDRATGDVCYDILAFSRPHRWLVRMGRPVARRVQKRFGHDSAAAMFRAANNLERK